MVFEKPDVLMSDVQSLVASQMQEMELVRQKVYALEQAQLNMKERYTTLSLSRSSSSRLTICCRYEQDIARLRHEIESRGGPPSHVGVSGLPPHGPVSQSQPPAIGHGPSNLFGGIMANPPGQGNPGLVPLSQDQQQPQGHPQNQMPQPPPGLHQPPFPNYPGGPVNGEAHYKLRLSTLTSFQSIDDVLTPDYRVWVTEFTSCCFPWTW